ncbi:MAG: MFS transporter [Chloroflexi bacterium]|nr:MFS transporter [Chloroflexota bacterium]
MDKRIFLILAFSMFASTLGIGIVIPLFPLYVKQMGASGLWIGLMFSAYAVSNSAFAPLFGRLADRRGRKWLLTFGLLAYAILSLGYMFAGSVQQLALVRLLQGIAGAMTFPIANAYIGDLSPEEEEGRWMGYASAIFFSGFGLGPLIGGVITAHFSMTAAFVTMGGFNFAAFLATLLFLPESPKRGINGEDEDGLLQSFRKISKSSIVRGLLSYQMVYALGSVGIVAFLPLLASRQGLDTTTIGILLTVNILSTTLLIPLGGILADRLNRRIIIVICASLAVVLLPVLTLANGVWQMVAVLVLLGMNNAISMPCASALAVEEGRKFGMGSIMSTLFLASGIGMAIGPVISGRIVDLFNIQSVFYFSSAMWLFGLGAFAWFTRHRTS